MSWTFLLKVCPLFRCSPMAAFGCSPRHRGERDWASVASRIGWLTWDDCEAMLPGSCKWLAMEPSATVERKAVPERQRPLMVANLPYTLDANFARSRLEKLIAEFESSAKRGIDRSLALKLRNELLESELPCISRRTVLQLAKWCKTNSPLYWDGMDVAAESANFCSDVLWIGLV